MAEKQAAKPAKQQTEMSPKLGPDPVVGVGLVIFGVLIMGVAGAATLHYLFNFGTGLAILGAIVFLVSVVVSSLRASQKASEPGNRIQGPPTSSSAG